MRSVCEVRSGCWEKGVWPLGLMANKPAGEEYFVVQVPFGSTEELARCAEAVIKGVTKGAK